MRLRIPNLFITPYSVHFLLTCEPASFVALPPGVSKFFCDPSLIWSAVRNGRQVDPLNAGSPSRHVSGKAMDSKREANDEVVASYGFS
jgi:hypothetical protein